MRWTHWSLNLVKTMTFEAVRAMMAIVPIGTASTSWLLSATRPIAPNLVSCLHVGSCTRIRVARWSGPQHLCSAEQASCLQWSDFAPTRGYSARAPPWGDTAGQTLPESRTQARLRPTRCGLNSEESSLFNSEQLFHRPHSRPSARAFHWPTGLLDQRTGRIQIAVDKPASESSLPSAWRTASKGRFTRESPSSRSAMREREVSSSRNTGF